MAPVRRRGRAGAARSGRRASRWPTTRRCAPRSPRSCRPTPASRRSAATGDAGPVGRPAPVRRRRVPHADGRARFSPLVPADRRRARRARSPCATRRGKQFNSMVFAADRPAHRRRPRRGATSTRPTPPRSALAEGDRVRLHVASRRVDGPRQARAPAPPHAAGPLARGQRADRRPAPTTASPARRFPTTTRSSRWSA